MKITLAQSAGFCFGVKRALNIALKEARKKPPVVMLGDIVHNEEVVQEIARAGVKKIKRLSAAKGKTLLIRAHGAPQKTIIKAKKAGYTTVDASCPMVKEIHSIAQRAEKRNCTVVVIGDKHHDEVRGIVGQLKKKAIVIDGLSRIPVTRLKKCKKVCVVVQSTQNIDRVLTLVEKIKKLAVKLEFVNTICQPTRTKQNEIKKLPLANDVMIVIGSKRSANTKRLYQIAKSLNPRTYWVQSKKDLKQSWFKGVKTVGVHAGASTPDKTTKSVIAFIKKTPS